MIIGEISRLDKGYSWYNYYSGIREPTSFGSPNII